MTAIPEIASLQQGEALLAARHVPEAIDCFSNAADAASDPDRCAAGLWTAHMLLGNFELAWKQSDAIHRRARPDPNRFWQGEPLLGKRVILRCLHGLGDVTQFLRYAPLLRALTSDLVVEVPPRFVDLARCFKGVDNVITWDVKPSSSSPPWEVQVEIMELPYLFRTQLTGLPVATSYLHLPPGPVSQLDSSSPLRVGLAWNAGSWNPARALSPYLLSPVLAVRSCEFFSLEGSSNGATDAEPSPSCMHVDALCRDSLLGLATAISQLDLVITVDTLAAHLAGALGIKAWVLLQHQADWRWMHDRSDSPWYPSLRLFRQPAPGDWASVISAVCGDLQNEADAKRNRKPTR